MWFSAKSIGPETILNINKSNYLEISLHFSIHCKYKVVILSAIEDEWTDLYGCNLKGRMTNFDNSFALHHVLAILYEQILFLNFLFPGLLHTHSLQC